MPLVQDTDRHHFGFSFNYETLVLLVSRGSYPLLRGATDPSLSPHHCLRLSGCSRSKPRAGGRVWRAPGPCGLWLPRNQFHFARDRDSVAPRLRLRPRDNGADDIMQNRNGWFAHSLLVIIRISLLASKLPNSDQLNWNHIWIWLFSHCTWSATNIGNVQQSATRRWCFSLSDLPIQI